MTHKTRQRWWDTSDKDVREEQPFYNAAQLLLTPCVMPVVTQQLTTIKINDF